MGKYGTAGQHTDENITRRVSIAGWITKATDTHSEYVTFIAVYTVTMVGRTRLQCYVIFSLSVLFKSDTPRPNMVCFNTTKEN